MTLLRASVIAALVAVAVGVTAYAGMNTPVVWAFLFAAPAGAVTLAGCLLSGTFDADWTVEPEAPSSSVTLHATSLTERLERSTLDQYRFTSRIQPRLRRIATAALQQDLDTPEARERLGPQLHTLLTATDAQLPPPKEFAALMRRLEELC
ncbi:DUF7269 family protein [Actinophytocola oryzae]|uniref:Uncharacterized protein n=1 Tax=Actinophytocola oryzae TaxID=502181 RepID=A0A4R7V970_9PSEU|nr:hypothetical protein [Actinophytocola oryzae]TDV45473.1 hypothetical protein CLV71_112140 [Actinophytocola oryzae]